MSVWEDNSRALARGLSPIQAYNNLLITPACICTVKPVLSGHSKRRPKFGFQDQLSLNAG